MPVVIQGELPVPEAAVRELWKAVINARGRADDEVTVRIVDLEEMRRLKREYKGVDEATNVLTFSYEAEHDIALCLEVAAAEAKVQAVPVSNYVAWLLVHAFLHAAGLDHERSEEEELETKRLEDRILRVAGFRGTAAHGGLWRGFQHAVRGVGVASQTEQHIRIEILAMLLAFGLALVLQLSGLALMLVLMLSVLVIGFELLNTSIEILCDAVLPHQHSAIRKVKDVAAAAVLLAVAVAFIGGLLLFGPAIANLVY